MNYTMRVLQRYLPEGAQPARVPDFDADDRASRMIAGMSATVPMVQPDSASVAADLEQRTKQ